MNFALIPTMLFALTVGYQAPSQFALTDGKKSVVVSHDQLVVTNLATEAQWAKMLYLGANVETTSSSNISLAGMRPYRVEYVFWTGVNFRIDDITLRAQFEHLCAHPVVTFAKGEDYMGLLGGYNRLTFTVSNGRMLGP